MGLKKGLAYTTTGSQTLHVNKENESSSDGEMEEEDKIEELNVDRNGSRLDIHFLISSGAEKETSSEYSGQTLNINKNFKAHKSLTKTLIILQK